MAQEIADSTLLDTWASSGLIVEPDISKIIEGWQLGEQPPHEYMNWLQNTFGSKLNHILKNGVSVWNNTTQYLAGSSVQHSGNVWLCKATNTNSAPTDANANWKRIITVESLDGLLNGYVDTTTNQTIAGIKTFSSTIAGSINGNSATATKLATARTINGVSFDGTANITVSDSTAVKLTGDQTIDGVKTFSSSPIVPTATTANQAVNLSTANSYDLGVGQTWQNVTSQRTSGVTYTNNTGRPIALSVEASDGKFCQIIVDGKYIQRFTDGGTGLANSGFSIVPSGATYSIIDFVTVFELR